MNSFILKLLGNLNLGEVLFALYKSGGEDAVRRFITVPEKTVRSICKRTGADPVKALEERGEGVEENIEFVQAMTEKDFEDPD